MYFSSCLAVIWVVRQHFASALTFPPSLVLPLQASSSEEERKRIFFLFGQLYEPGAALIAEMLGFDPKMVLDKQDGGP